MRQFVLGAGREVTKDLVWVIESHDPNKPRRAGWILIMCRVDLLGNKVRRSSFSGISADYLQR
jgi:hypothetical protein